MKGGEENSATKCLRAQASGSTFVSVVATSTAAAAAAATKLSDER
jgi:hypothetical protein